MRWAFGRSFHQRQRILQEALQLLQELRARRAVHDPVVAAEEDCAHLDLGPPELSVLHGEKSLSDEVCLKCVWGIMPSLCMK